MFVISKRLFSDVPWKLRTTCVLGWVFPFLMFAQTLLFYFYMKELWKRDRRETSANNHRLIIFDHIPFVLFTKITKSFSHFFVLSTLLHVLCFIQSTSDSMLYRSFALSSKLQLLLCEYDDIQTTFALNVPVIESTITESNSVELLCEWNFWHTKVFHNYMNYSNQKLATLCRSHFKLNDNNI